MKGGN